MLLTRTFCFCCKSSDQASVLVHRPRVPRLVVESVPRSNTRTAQPRWICIGTRNTAGGIISRMASLTRLWIRQMAAKSAGFHRTRAEASTCPSPLRQATPPRVVVTCNIRDRMPQVLEFRLGPGLWGFQILPFWTA